MIIREQMNYSPCLEHIDTYQDNWYYHTSQNPKLSENFIREYKDEVDWKYISSYRRLSEKLIREFKDKVYWLGISINQQLSEDFIREFKDKIYWNWISKHQKLSENFIREFKDKVDWFCISTNQKLSENFIREFQDKVNWFSISTYQKLSENFIREFQDKVDWTYISSHQKLSESFRKEFNITVPERSWLYANIKKKRKAVKKFYELDGDYVIAYKSTREDGYSVYNFQYKYEVDKTYESHCNCNLDEEYSFGLSAWTQQGALYYYSKGKLFKVRIHLNDLGAMTYDCKLRCFKLEVLEEIKYDNTKTN